MSVIRPALSSSERTTERRAVTVIRRSPSFLRPQTIVEGLPQETPTDPYLAGRLENRRCDYGCKAERHR